MANKKKPTPKKNNTGKFLKLIVAGVLLQVIVYAWIHLYLSYKVGVEIAPMTSVAFFTLCVGELGICGYIKKS
jgi:hypothetical protein